jgi:hypothetical protein
VSTGRGCCSRGGGGGRRRNFLAKGTLKSSSLFVIIYYNLYYKIQCLFVSQCCGGLNYEQSVLKEKLEAKADLSCC